MGQGRTDPWLEAARLRIPPQACSLQPSRPSDLPPERFRYNAPVEKRYFTLAEARQLLPRIKHLMGRAVDLSQEMQGYEKEVRGLGEKSGSDSGGPVGTSYLECLLALRECIDKVQRTGCLVKSVQDGLIDFPHWKEDREVYLCWRYGEDDIRFWHEVDAGFAGRQPVEE